MRPLAFQAECHTALRSSAPLFLVDGLPICSYFVLMESSEQKRRFPPPWRAEPTEHGYVVKDANGVTLACAYSRDDYHKNGWSFAHQHLTSDEARRIAKGIARLPEFMKAEPAFPAREVTRIGRWRSSHPYHVALQEAYVQENYDEIAACCRYNRVPFDSTGEKIQRGFVRWSVYEFAFQFDAIRFWDKFGGKWIVGDDFIEPEAPRDLKAMQSLRNRGAL